MAEKVTLKKPDGTIIYPQTKIDTTEIYDGAVTSAKIDWTTMSYVQNSASTATAMSNTTASAKISATIPANGVYLCIANANFSSNTTTLHDTFLSVMKGTTVLSESGFYGGQQSAISGLLNLSAFAIAQFNAGDTVSLGARVAIASTRITDRRIIAIRIA